jgi:transposase
VAGSFERFLIERGERVLRVPTKLMAHARRGGRERGKFDSIDSVAVARAKLREGLDELAVAQLDWPELDIRLLVDHRERLVRQRVGLNNTMASLRSAWPPLLASTGTGTATGAKGCAGFRKGWPVAPPLPRRFEHARSPTREP